MKWNAGLYDQSHDFVSMYGKAILSYLHPQPQERILDLGCGTADLTHEIAAAGASVIGIDSSSSMLQKAREKYPGLTLEVMDARTMQFSEPFNAVFSNAVLHWIPEKEKVIARIYAALKDKGRFVAEFGGKGNNASMIAGLKEVLIRRGYSSHATLSYWYYPSIAEYATELEKQSFRVTRAEHIDRPTPLKGENGLRDWFLMFGEYYLSGIPEAEKLSILDEVQQHLATAHYIDGTWYADYKRIRIVAVKE